MSGIVPVRWLHAQHDFFENLVFVLEAGLNLQEAVFSAVDCAADEDAIRLRNSYRNIGACLRRGQSFSAALAASLPGLSALQLAMVAGGEKTGTVLPALRLLVLQAHERIDDHRQLVAALAYPLVVVALTICGSLVFSISWATGHLGPPLNPGSLRSLVAANLLVLLVLALISSGGLLLAHAENGLAGWQQACRRLTRKLPLVGVFLELRELHVFCALASQLCHAGLSFSDAFEHACKALPEASPLRREGMAAVVAIKKGTSASCALRSAVAWPARVAAWMAMAERSGQPAKAFELLQAYYRERYTARRTLLIRLAEPAGVLLAGLCILPILAAFVSLVMAAGVSLVF